MNPFKRFKFSGSHSRHASINSQRVSPRAATSAPSLATTTLSAVHDNAANPAGLGASSSDLKLEPTAEPQKTGPSTPVPTRRSPAADAFARGEQDAHGSETKAQAANASAPNDPEETLSNGFSPKLETPEILLRTRSRTRSTPSISTPQPARSIEGCRPSSSTGIKGENATRTKKKSTKGVTKPSIKGRNAGLAACGTPATVPEKLGDHPLRLIITGHNPSWHAWNTGHYYSNPSNWMWRLLRETGIAPPHVRGAQDDGLMLADAGVGFTDVGSGIPGTDSSEFSSETFQSWRDGFYARLCAHVKRASDSIGCVCGSCGAPSLIAFSGKRQYSELVNHGRKGKAILRNLPLGRQEHLPENWPLPLSTEVWVCCSTSGASPMTNQQRLAPYQALADRMAAVAWPRDVKPSCLSS